MERPISRAGESAEARRVLSLLDGRSLAENDIDRDVQGRPFFPGREAVNFNISHSGALTAVSYAKGGNLRTGCDVEQIRRRARIREIAEEFFSVAETNYIFSHGGFDESRFYEIWTLKECFIKLRGLSVFDMAVCPSFINTEDTFIFGAAVSSPLLFYLYELSGGKQRYILSAALEGTEQQPPEIRWFSQSSLTCKMIAEIKAAPSPDETVSPKM
jgi:hypothetical protein